MQNDKACKKHSTSESSRHIASFCQIVAELPCPNPTITSHLNDSVANNHVINVHNESVSDNLDEVNCPMADSHPAIGEHSNVSVCMWNIRGISNKLNDSEIQKMLFDHDIIILVETMKDCNFEIDVPGFTSYHYGRKKKHKKAKRVSGGIGIMIRDSISKAITVDSPGEIMVWVTLKSKYFTGATKDIKIAGVYLPPNGASYVSDINQPFHFIEGEIAKYVDSHYIYLCGDFNSRTAVRPDHNGNNTLPYSNADFPFQRFNCDKTVNSFGLELLSLCKKSEIFIMNGRFFTDKNIGGLTCFENNGCSTVDYLIATHESSKLLNDFNLGKKCVESNHVNLHFDINVRLMKNAACNNTSPQSTVCKDSFYRFIWDTSKLEQYIARFNSDECNIRLGDFACSFIEPTSIRNVCDSFNSYIRSAAGGLFSKVKVNKKQTKKSFPTNEWFDQECKNFKSLANTFSRKNNLSTEINRSTYRNIQKQYKSMVQRKKRQVQNKKLNELECKSRKSPTEYWKLWKSLQVKKSQNNSKYIKIDDFFDQFQKQIYPPDIEYFDHSHINDINEKLSKCSHRGQ